MAMKQVKKERMEQIDSVLMTEKKVQVKKNVVKQAPF